jgi:hypothetical protein
MMLREMGIRKDAYPFDWLWNLDDGLRSVTHMIATDFAGALAANPYRRKAHYRVPGFPVVYGDYPSIIHMHSNPLESASDDATMRRRVERFTSALSSSDTLHFVYYKNFNEELIKDLSRSVLDTV